MPTYEYRCKECSHEFEIQQSFTDDALTECPTCHGALRKVFGNVGISFKGSGFYKTDSRGSSSSEAGSSGSSGSATSSDSTTASDTKKPETKTSETKKTADSSSSTSSTTSAA